MQQYLLVLRATSKNIGHVWPMAYLINFRGVLHMGGENLRSTSQNRADGVILHAG
jgi:hypothetical protein